MPIVTEKKLQTRSPVVVVMGHVDHGKTSLIDYIRKSNVAAKEAGEITQSIGAYEIVHNSKRVTFIDTPGHEAFSAMRARGANVADVAVLVVAGDEGVKPQTEEAIKILRDSKTPFVVAITKADKANTNLEKVKGGLAGAGVLLEGYGGQVSFQAVSAKTGEGVSEMLDLILLTADLENLSYDPDVPASGFVLETLLDPRRGIETTLIVKNGTLRAGEEIATPSAGGKVKILEDFTGARRELLTPSAPALIIGFESLPHVGEEFRAGSGAAGFTKIPEASAPRTATPGSPPEYKDAIKIVLKASDAGSLEVLSTIVRGIQSQKPVLILGESVGDISDGDIKTAIAGEAIVVGFKNKIGKPALRLAETHDIRIVTSEVVYDLVKAVEEFIAHADESNISGELELLAVFNQEKLRKQVVGGRVAKGIFRNKAHIEIMRGAERVGSGRVLNLQQNKKDVGQANEGSDAGILLESGIALKAGDRLVIKKHKEE